MIVAYLFPPTAGAGVQRTAKFIRYLPEHGWESAVLTTASRAYPVQDPSLLSEVSDVTQVVRAFDPPPLRWLARGLDGLRQPKLRDAAGWPDPALAWTPAALVAGLRMIRRHRPDVIMTTAAPFSAHLVGAALHRATGIPWVADFRDEWASNPYIQSQPRVVRALSSRIERAVCRSADRVSVAADYFELEGARRDDERRLTITNGVDENDLPAGGGSPPPDRMRLSFVGTLYGSRDAEAVLSALARLMESAQIDRKRVELRIVGNVWLPPDSLAHSMPMSQTGYVDHAHALREMTSASALLFYEPADSMAPTGKIFEYLASGRPILCVARRDNLAFRLVEEWGAGVCAEPGSAAAIEKAIQDLYRRWLAGDLTTSAGVREKVLRRFSRRHLTGRLAAALEATAGQGQRDVDAA